MKATRKNIAWWVVLIILSPIWATIYAPGMFFEALKIVSEKATDALWEVFKGFVDTAKNTFNRLAS